VAPVTPPVDEAFDRLETYVRDLGRRAHRPPGAIPEQREIFVPVTGPIPSTDVVEYRRLPAARAASVIHRGGYSGIGAVRVALERWVAAAGLARTGPMRTLYLQFGADPGLGIPPGWTVDSDELFVTELQLPIT
jgi:effector-binding domain-containing protein